MQYSSPPLSAVVFSFTNLHHHHKPIHGTHELYTMHSCPLSTVHLSHNGSKFSKFSPSTRNRPPTVTQMQKNAARHQPPPVQSLNLHTLPSPHLVPHRQTLSTGPRGPRGRDGGKGRAELQTFPDEKYIRAVEMFPATPIVPTLDPTQFPP